MVTLFTDPDRLKFWQPGLINVEHIRGTPGQIGAQTRLQERIGKRDINIIETITESSLPDLHQVTYEAKNVWNMVTNHFISIDKDTTRWVFDSEFHCKGIFRVIIILMPDIFKKQSMKYMSLFKEFVEKSS